MSLLSLMLQGGILMYVLLLLSILVLAIVIEKYRHLAKVNKENKATNELIDFATGVAGLKAALAETSAHSPIAAMYLRVLENPNQDKELMMQSLESAANFELHKLEKGMGWLSTFAAIAPLIGFLGTVIGMVRVFMNIQHQSSAGIDINILAGGIWEALLTTVGGLIVGIIAIVFYNDILTRLESIMQDLQDGATKYLLKFHQKQ